MAALEYFHAIWSCFHSSFGSTPRLDEADAAAIFDLAAELRHLAMLHSLASTSRAGGGEFGSATGQLEFHARSSWIMIRGNRYQVLEEEFFAFVLAPHDAALRDAYGVGAAEVASGIQAIATAMREGLNGAIATLDARMKATYQFATDRGVALDVAIRTLAETDPSGSIAAAGALRDLLRGGCATCHATLPCRTRCSRTLHMGAARMLSSSVPATSAVRLFGRCQRA
jgi:hypothetical protein